MEEKNTEKNVVQYCTFTGVHWDAKAIEAVNMVAQGLLNLTELFKSQNIEIESMLKIDSSEKNDKLE